jgi:acetate kinase
MSTLAINAGSSSLKFGLFDDKTLESLVTGEIDWAGGDRHEAQLNVRPARGAAVRSRIQVPDDGTAAASAIKAAADAAESLVGGPAAASAVTAVGHRVVHGGDEFRDSVLIDHKVKKAIDRLGELAPLHNPAALRAIEAAEAALPGKPNVAVFDTAFYARLAPESFLYGVPYAWFERWGIRRFGFHGISHAYCAQRAAEMMRREPGQLRTITCHLGGGCSATAVRAGIAIATTSGFTPLDGLMMGTRCGSIDPGILLHVQRQHGLTPEEMGRVLNQSSGLMGISGISPDLARIESAVKANPRARLAWGMFVSRVRDAVGAMAANLGGLDALVFTDRVGERSAAVRAGVCENLQFMGVRLDLERNADAVPDTDVAAADSPARVLVIHTEEELAVAREVRRVLA